MSLATAAPTTAQFNFQTDRAFLPLYSIKELRQKQNDSLVKQLRCLDRSALPVGSLTRLDQWLAQPQRFPGCPVPAPTGAEFKSPTSAFSVVELFYDSNFQFPSRQKSRRSYANRKNGSVYHRQQRYIGVGAMRSHGASPVRSPRTLQGGLHDDHGDLFGVEGY